LATPRIYIYICIYNTYPILLVALGVEEELLGLEVVGVEATLGGLEEMVLRLQYPQEVGVLIHQ
jgi:hypothetical protein